MTNSIIILPACVEGYANVPASKSFMQRALCAAMLSKGETEIVASGFSEDVYSVIDLVRSLGVSVDLLDGKILVRSNGIQYNPKVDMGESGLAARMFTPLLSLFHKPLIINGYGSLLARDMKAMEKGLKTMGVAVESSNDRLPFKVTGPILPGSYAIELGNSSQFLSGLLMALPLLKDKSVIEVDRLVSEPYLKMTIQVLNDFGVNIIREQNIFTVQGNQRYNSLCYHCESDWSSAAVMLAAGALGGIVGIKGLKIKSLQADRHVLDLICSAGIKAKITTEEVCFERSKISAFQFDATHCPDLFPVLAVLAANANGTSTIAGVGRLYNKESNRAVVIQDEFSKLGMNIKLDQDRMIIKGGKICGGIINSHNDHRIAMAGALAAINADGPVEIINPECVSKSFPGFFQEFKKLQK